MKGRNLALALMATIVFYSCGSSDKSGDTSGMDSTTVTSYTVDAAASVVTWKGSMVGMYSHNGTISLTQGAVELTGGKLSAGNFVIDLKTINPLDSGYSAEHPREGLIGHLAAPDFFASDSFPTASFVVKSVEGNVATGDLTLRGKTNEEKVTDLVITADSTSLTATGKLVFNRQKYNVAYKSTMKDMVLSDDIEIGVSLQAKK